MELIITDHDKCVNCNKCINVCPTEFANTVIKYNNKLVLSVNPDLCIGCGECITVCDHGGRDFIDDTERFFSDLNNGVAISLAVAPSAKFNFPKLGNLLGFLKGKGIRFIYDVSLGADITTWAYLKTIKEHKVDSLISQPCPVVVNYIERFKPELIDSLASIHSPLLCAAIYIKEYKKNPDSIAFLSPCIAKITEIRDPNTDNRVQYNVTFTKLLAYLETNNINVDDYEQASFDDLSAGLGVVFSKPGGLRENIEYHIPGTWIRQIEGASHLYRYLDEYAARIKSHKEIPVVIDCLNCASGCNLGTGTTKSIPIDDIDGQIKRVRNTHLKKWENNNDNQVGINYTLFDLFDNTLQLESFRRQYTDHSSYTIIKEPTAEQLHEVFMSMLKLDDESRKINCYSCGYQSCTTFAKAVFNGFNQKENCFRYNREISRLEHEENEIVYGEMQRLNELLEQKVIERTQELEFVNMKLEKLLRIDDLTNIPNRKAFDEQLAREWKRSMRQQEPLSFLMFDIDCFKQYNDNYGHVQGDSCLKTIASALVASLGRGTDFVARYGGEEFVVLLPNTDEQGAFKKAEMIREKIENLMVTHDFSTVNKFVTVSIGINTIIACMDDCSVEFVKKADMAMYQAKAKGRNQSFHAMDL